MDPTIFAGILVVGVGIGLVLQNPTRKQEPGSVVCHCECPSERTVESASPVSVRELLLVLVIGNLLGAFAVITFRHRHIQVPLVEPTPSTTKGKGRKGVFGSSVALSIEG